MYVTFVRSADGWEGEGSINVKVSIQIISFTFCAALF